MCMDVLTYGAGLGLNISGTLEHGGEEKRRAYFAAEEKVTEAGHLQEIGIEKAHEVEVEKGEAVGQAEAARGKAGIKAGGSADTLLNKIKGRARRKQELLQRETSMRIGTLDRQAKELRRRGRKAQIAARMDAWTIALGGGYKIGKKLLKDGKTKKDSTPSTFVKTKKDSPPSTFAPTGGTFTE